MPLPWYLRGRPCFWWGAGLVAGFLALATWVTYRTGGTVNVFPHLFYIPVVIGGFLYGAPGGLVVGLLAGVLCGPFMPKDVEQGIPQSTDGWVIRMLFFTAIGTLAGWLAKSLHNRITALEGLHEQTVLAFVRAIDAKDHYTAQHSENVARYATMAARQMGLPHRDVERIRLAALLHDVGKIAIPGSILNKPGKLTPEEYEIVKGHPVASVRIVGAIKRYQEYLPGIRHHHERLDGKGYPDGIRGPEVPLDARIIAVADAFEAMTSDRAYRPAMPKEEAIRRLQECCGSQFDPQVVQALIRALEAEEALEPGRWEGQAAAAGRI